MPTPLTRAKMTVASAPGLGTISLNAAYEAGQTFASAGVHSGDQIIYSAYDGSNFEQGLGVYTSTSGQQLSRDTVTLSSNNNLKVDLGANTIVYAIAIVAAPSGINPLTPAGLSGDVQINQGANLGAISRVGGNANDYLARDNTYKSVAFVGGGGGGGGTGTSANSFNTRDNVMASTIDNSIQVIKTFGYATIGDNGGGVYVSVSSQPDHAGWIKSADNRYWELVPDAGEIWVEQFGALGSKTNFNYKGLDSSVGMNAAVDYVMFSPWKHAGITLMIGGGFHYMAHPMVLKGSFNIKGTASFAQGISNSASYLRPEVDTDGIFGCSLSCIARNIGQYQTFFPYKVGDMIYYGDSGGAPNADARLHVYRVSAIVGGTTVFDDYNQVTLTVGNAAGPGPSGTGTNIVDGQVRWDYVRETTRVERVFDEFCGSVSNLVMFSYWNPTQNVDGSWNDPAQPFNTACGMLFTNRAMVKECWIGQFSQHLVAFVNNGDPSLPLCTGNTDYWCIKDCSLYYAGSDALHAGDMNGNAGYAEHLDIAFAGRWAVAEWSFLGNEYNQLQDAGSGDIRIVRWAKAHCCFHNGYVWQARMPIKGLSNWPNYDTTEPGTNDAVWALFFGDGTLTAPGTTGGVSTSFPAWGGAIKFEPGGSYSTLNANACNLWCYAYIEGGENYTQFGIKDVVIGGPLQQLVLPIRGNVIMNNTWYAPLTSAYSKVFAAPHNTAWTWSVTMGGMDPVGPKFLAMTANATSFDTMFWLVGKSPDGFAHWDIVCRTDLGATDRFVWTTGDTHQQCGRTATYLDGGSMILRGLYIGRNGPFYSRRLDSVDGIGSVTGSSVESAAGDITFVQSASNGQAAAYYCTVGGVPGIHVPFAPIGGKRYTIRSGFYTPVLDDGFNTVIETDNTVNIPANASVAFQVGTELEVVCNTTSIGITAAAGVTLRVPSGMSTTLSQWQKVKLRQRSINDWVLSN